MITMLCNSFLQYTYLADVSNKSAKLRNFLKTKDNGLLHHIRGEHNSEINIQIARMLSLKFKTGTKFTSFATHWPPKACRRHCAKALF